MNGVVSVNGQPKRRKKKNYRKIIASGLRKHSAAWLIMLPGILLFLIFVWQPLVSGVALSFFQTKGFDPVKFIGFRNYADVLTDSAFKQAMLNSFMYTLWSLLIGFCLPIITAILLNEIVHIKSFIKLSLYFPSMTPGIVTAIIWLLLYDPGKGGLLNMMITSMGFNQFQWLQSAKHTIPLIVISMTWKAAGGTTILYLAAIQGINQELYEAAKMDGAGIFSRIIRITVPQISNMISLMFIMQIINVFQVMVEPLSMTDGGPNNASITLALQSYFYAFRFGQVGKSIALSVITFLILMVFTFIYLRISKQGEGE